MSAVIRVLLVEDDDVARDGFKAALEQAGFEVEAVEDGAEGLAALLERPGRFAAIVTDVNLPTLSGPEMIRKAGETVGTAGVIYLSGFAPDAGWPEGRTMSKPIGREDLVKAVRDAASSQ
jgi:two-component system cell cycle response regulator CpdR